MVIIIYEYMLKWEPKFYQQLYRIFQFYQFKPVVNKIFWDLLANIIYCYIFLDFHQLPGVNLNLGYYRYDQYH